MYGFRSSASPPGAGVAVGREGRLLAQDAARELPQLRRRLDPELVDEQPTALVVETDRLRLPASPVEREHQLRAELLAQWVSADELLELADECPVRAELQVGGDSPLERAQPELLQAADRGLGEGVVGEVRQRRPSPQRERLPQVLGGRASVAAFELARSGVDHALEALCIERVRLDTDEIPGRPSLEDRLGLGPEPLAQLGDVVANLAGGSGRRRTVVERVDELLDRYDLVGT